jgi:quinol monooxygenase YgiN
VHTDLLRRADLPTTFLVQEFWESERHFALADRNAEVRNFLQWIRTLAVGHQRLGAFSFRNAWESESNFETSFWAPAEFARQQVRQ